MVRQHKTAMVVGYTLLSDVHSHNGRLELRARLVAQDLAAAVFIFHRQYHVQSDYSEVCRSSSEEYLSLKAQRKISLLWPTGNTDDSTHSLSAIRCKIKSAQAISDFMA